MRTIDRRLRWGAWALVVIASASSARAQRPHLTPTDVAQIANEALRVVVPPESTFSGVSAARRGVAFDVRGTLTAFGAGAESDTAVRLARHVDVVSDRVLSDCSQMAPKPCAGLGSRVYVSVEPLSLTNSRAHVRVHVRWPDRGEALGRSSGAAYLTGFSATIHLVRNAAGTWVFQTQDRSVLVM